MLVEFLQNRRHVLARNPHFRGEPYPCEGEAGDEAAGLLADCGQPTPFLDRIVFSIEKEAIPLQGKFLQGYYDIPQVERGEYGVAMLVAAGDSVEKAELYAQRGLKLPTTVETQNWYMGFNWLDPVVGAGDTPEQAERNRKLRQAVSIAGETASTVLSTTWSTDVLCVSPWTRRVDCWPKQVTRMAAMLRPGSRWCCISTPWAG